MATLLLSLNDDLLHRLLAEASSANLGLEDHIRKVLEGIIDMPERLAPSDMLQQAIERAKAKAPGEEFTLQALFPNAAEWEQIPKPRVFGRVFRQALESTNPRIAVHIGKTVTNKAIYKRN
jgi:hypothetical protein